MATEYKLVELTEKEYKQKSKNNVKAGAISCQCCIAYSDEELCGELGWKCLSTKNSYFIEVKENN